MNQTQSFTQRCNSMLDTGKHLELEELLTNELKDFVLSKHHENLSHLMEIVGLYIDLGEESRNKDCVTIGLKIIQDNRDQLKKIFSQCSI